MDWELDQVERPFAEQLLSMGWSCVEGDLDQPAKPGRASFTEVMQEARCAASCMRSICTPANPGWTRRACPKRWAR
jgi:hypothetical protein